MQLIHGLHFDNIRGDVYGGLTAAVVALPLALAFGVASGRGPDRAMIAGMRRCAPPPARSACRKSIWRLTAGLGWTQEQRKDDPGQRDDR